MKIKWLFMILVVACVGSFAEETVSLATLQESAAKGDAQAQFNLGYRYTLKEDLDLPKAFTWFKKAGDQNHAEAQYYVGLMYKSGQGVEKNPEASMAWLKMAAHQNHIMAQVKIGMSYYMGNSGVEMDLKESAKQFGNTAVSISAELSGQANDVCYQLRFIIGHTNSTPLGRARLSQDSTGTPFRHPKMTQLTTDIIHCCFALHRA